MPALDWVNDCDTHISETGDVWTRQSASVRRKLLFDDDALYHIEASARAVAAPA